eukprot:12724313-Ditylum_brightwellii.AAC.1
MAEGSELATATLCLSLKQYPTPQEIQQNSSQILNLPQGWCCTCTAMAKCQTHICSCFCQGMACTTCTSRNCCNDQNRGDTISNTQNNGQLSECRSCTVHTSAISFSRPMANINPIASTQSSCVLEDLLYSIEELPSIDKCLILVYNE